MRLMIIIMPVIAFVAILASSLASSIQGKYDEAAVAGGFHPEAPEARAILIRHLNKVKKAKEPPDQATLRRACALAE
jgi:hypothetical protein